MTAFEINSKRENFVEKFKDATDFSNNALNKTPLVVVLFCGTAYNKE